MQTALLQSYRSTDGPEWITRCMASAQSLADAKNWTYRFMNDDFFDFVPETIRTKFNNNTAMMSDLARLRWAMDVFEKDKSVERVIWLDADVCVFAPQMLEIDDKVDFAVGRQIWVQPDQEKGLKIFTQVHNAVLVITRRSPVLGFLVDRIATMASRMERISSPQMFGPKLLTALHNIVGFDVIDAVGMASPLVMRDLTQGNGRALDTLIKNSKQHVAALNLCGSYWNQTIDDILCDDALYNRAVEFLFSKQMGLVD